jgi:hypothetical protein
MYFAYITNLLIAKVHTFLFYTLLCREIMNMEGNHYEKIWSFLESVMLNIF